MCLLLPVSVILPFNKINKTTSFASFTSLTTNGRYPLAGEGGQVPQLVAGYLQQLQAQPRGNFGSFHFQTSLFFLPLHDIYIITHCSGLLDAKLVQQKKHATGNQREIISTFSNEVEIEVNCGKNLNDKYQEDIRPCC